MTCAAATLAALPAGGACLETDYSVAAEFKRSVAVIVLEAKNSRPGPATSDGATDSTFYSGVVSETLRGHLRGSVDVYSENSTARFTLEKGKTYLLFLYNSDGHLTPDNCGNSGLVTEKAAALAEARALSKTDQR
jgi:hypothetical protein